MKAQLAVVMLIGLSLTADAADDVARFQFKKTVEMNTAAGEEIIAVALDSDVYAGTRDGYPDLRIVDDRGTMVPYLLEAIGKKRIKRVRETCASKLVSLHVDEGKGLEILVALDAQAPSALGLSIHTPLADYEHRVRVFGSQSGKDWTPVVTDGVVFDYSRFIDIRNRDIALPENQYRQFKVIIDQELDDRESPLHELLRAREEGKDGKKETHVELTAKTRTPFRIDRVEVWRTVESEGGTESESFRYATTDLRVENDAKAKLSRVEIESRREPLKSLSIATSSRNFSRKARVLVPVERGVRTDWVEIGRSTIVNIQFRAFHRAELQVDFAEQRQKHFRLEIENADNPPLDITGVDAAGAGYRLVFLRSEGRTYRLEYGSDTALAPSYDTGAVLASLDRGYQPVSVKLGPEVPIPGHRGRGGLGAFLNSPLFLILAIVVMVLVLAWAIFRAGESIKKLPMEDA